MSTNDLITLSWQALPRPVGFLPVSPRPFSVGVCVPMP